MNEAMIFDNVEKWIPEVKVDRWFSALEKYKSFGDESDAFVLLQRTTNVVDGVYVPGVTIVKIGVPETFRRRRVCSRIMKVIEDGASAHGLCYVRVSCVVTREMNCLLERRNGYVGYGYATHPIGGWPNDYIKVL